jgi:hypothetical protein
MKPNSTAELTIPPALQAEIHAAAAAAHRPANEIVREALETYLVHQQTEALSVTDAQTRSATVTRMFERRRGRHLSDGVTIEDVIAWGREGRA